jgi:hypothetical protein
MVAYGGMELKLHTLFLFAFDKCMVSFTPSRKSYFPHP